MSAHRITRKPALALLATLSFALAALLTTTTPASAFFGRPQIAEFGSFSYATGDTLDQSTGNVYVINGDSVNEFEVFGSEGGAPAGGVPSKFNGSGNPAKGFHFDGEVQSPAFDAVNHVLWFPDAHNDNVEKYKFEGGEYKFVCQIIAGGTPSGTACTTSGASGSTHFDEPLGVAVDKSGNLYVSDWGSSNIFEFNPAGEQIAVFPLEYRPQYLAVAPTGTLYINPYRNDPVYEYKRSSLTGPVEGAPVELPGGGASGIAVNQSNGDLIIDRGDMVEEVNAKDEPVGGTAPGTLGGSGEGVAIYEATNHLYVVANQKVHEFGLGVLLPDVTTNEAKKVARNSAELCGTINADEVAKTRYFFEYGLSTSYESSTPKVELPGEPSTPTVVCATVSGLTAGATYHYRLVGENGNGANVGSDASFETPLAVEGMKNKPPTDVTTESATLNAVVEPNGEATTCWFQYGEGYAFNVETAHESAGSQLTGEKAVVATVGGLQPNKEYQYRLVCTNPVGTSTAPGSEGFVTLKRPPVVIAEEVSNVARTRAVLLAKVNPENEQTTYYFEYGLNADEYGYKTPPTTLQSAGYGEALAQAVAVELESNTVYHFRVVARNAAGTDTGPDATFTSGTLTPPVVTTLGVSNLGQIGVTLEGLVTTQGLVTSYGFEISTNPEAFGPPTGLGSVGAGFNEAPATLTLTGLKPGTKYYYKLVGTNPDGSSEGEVHEFTTLTYPSDQIAVEQLRVLTEPFTAWPTAANLLYLKVAPKVVTKPKKVKKHKGKKAKGKSKKGKGKSKK